MQNGKIDLDVYTHDLRNLLASGTLLTSELDTIKGVLASLESWVEKYFPLKM